MFQVFAACLFMAACALPRGAALTGEVTREQDSASPTFQVMPVTRANLPQIRAWPVTGWSGAYRWPESTRGPDSPLVRTGDRIDLVIWDSQENSLLTPTVDKKVALSGLTVSPGGSIFVPYLDEIQIAGQTPEEARRQIQTALEPIVPSAQVQLSVVAGRQSSVDLLAGVARPGTFPLPDRNHTILSVIATGGGIAPSLRHPLVRLMREGTTYEIRAERLFSDASRNVLLRGGDKIVVEEDRRYFTALGATGTERLVYFQKEDISALEAISIIGGLTDSRANPKGVIVLRDYEAQQMRNDGRGPEMPQVVFTFDLTSADGLFAARSFPINPKDTVLATESPVTGVQTVVGLLGSLLGLAGRVNTF
ncbi:MAG: polysaccharide biosynthesis protein [Rhodobacterales bacterium 34-62-10]|nr:MAG: polysaccharide biosynthesis protein [Rhodobacterales bacterium 34-62-10]